MPIRSATADDISTIQGIARQVISHNYTPFLGCDNVANFIDSGQSDKEISDGISRGIVLQKDTDIIGFAIISDDLLHLIMIDVPYQNKGYGAALLTYAEPELFQHHPIIRLQSFEQNKAAVRFYRKHGWQIKEKTPIDGLNRNMLIMEKASPTS